MGNEEGAFQPPVCIRARGLKALGSTCWAGAWAHGCAARDSPGRPQRWPHKTVREPAGGLPSATTSGTRTDRRAQRSSPIFTEAKSRAADKRVRHPGGDSTPPSLGEGAC